MDKEVHSLSSDAVIALLNSSRKGLSKKEANERLLKYGNNELIAKERVSALKIFLSQFNSVLIWIMFGAVILSFAVKEYIDAAAILIILILNKKNAILFWRAFQLFGLFYPITGLNLYP